MGQDTANRKTSELKSQRIATMMALLLCVGLAIVVSWSAGYSLSSCEGTKVTNAPSRAAARVFSSGSYDRLTRDKTAKQLGWEKHAKANLTNYKNNILSLVRPHYGKQGFWSVFLPIISCPPDRPLTRYGGTGDGSKLLCSLPSSLQQPGCVIYSLGSNGNYEFERAMLEVSRCELHTFDCTYKAGTSQSPGRHFYHHWCLGEPHQGQQYRTWSNITASLGHKKVHLLKMDIEGYEHDVLPAWKAEHDLPDEISIEIHAKPGTTRPGTAAELGLTFMHLANLGYAAYSQEVNSWGPDCCAELSFLRLGSQVV